MNKYFFILKNQIKAFQVQCKKWKIIKPIKILQPPGYILPYSLIYDEDVKGVLNPNRLENLEVVEKKDITPSQSEL
jgi:hypothetical protein